MIYDVAVIGGGISGLTVAYDLLCRGGKRGRKVIVLERQQQVGGNAISQNINGFLMEHGPTTLNALVPQARQLSDEIGLGEQQIDLGKGIVKRYLRQGNRLHGIGIKPTGFLLSSYLSLGGRAALLREVFQPGKTTGRDETVHAFASRRFGREFADKVMDPLAAGMFAGDAKKLSIQASFPTLLEMEKKHGSIVRGVMSARRGSEPAKRLFSFRNGIGNLPMALGNLLGESVRTGVAVKSVRYCGGGYRIDTHGHGNLSANSLVLAVQPHVAAQLLSPLDEIAAETAAGIDAPPMSVVFVAYERDQVDHRLDSLGFMSVKNSGGIITGAQFQSTMFEGRAPRGHVCIAAYVGGVRNRDAAIIDRDELVAMVHGELAGLLGIKGQPVLSRCRQWPRSLPQYELGHGDKVGLLKSLGERQQGLYLTGNYLTGVSMANCIGQARSVAGEVEKYLATRDQSLWSKISAG